MHIDGSRVLSNQSVRDSRTAHARDRGETGAGTLHFTRNLSSGSHSIQIVSTGEDPEENLAPSVQITRPSSGAEFSTDETIAVEATASDPEGQLDRVEFLLNGSEVGEDRTVAYTATMLITEPGTHVLAARAVDSQGATAIDEVTITLTSGGPS